MSLEEVTDTKSREMIWRLLGLDAFDEEAEPYILGEYDNEQNAIKAAYRRLDELERIQPTADSGGQAPSGIQDRVFIESPDGRLTRITTKVSRQFYFT